MHLDPNGAKYVVCHLATWQSWLRTVSRCRYQGWSIAPFSIREDSVLFAALYPLICVPVVADLYHST